MCLQGYPPALITILTPYNGQKYLIRDILHEKCSSNPKLFGIHPRVTTTDKFQGQQSDYILLSLTRSKHLGHISDIRRLIVALSRARLGLYIFGNLGLLEEGAVADPQGFGKSFQVLRETPTTLMIHPQDRYNTGGYIHQGVVHKPVHIGGYIEMYNFLAIHYERVRQLLE